jgi:membrane dipeptidase
VGLSSDFNHGGGVAGFADVGAAPNVTRELLRRGYTEPQINKLWGENFLRVLREVERVAHGG